VSRLLPPLVALRSFECAARRLSFKDAASELNVTPSAVSHQIHNLESFLKTPLFHRANRALALTDAGEAYLQKIRLAFDSIEQATADLIAQEREAVLTLTAPPSLTATWLVPRLRSFRERYPGIGVRVKGTMENVDYLREGVDASIRYGYGDWPGLDVERLSLERMLVLCSPAYLKREGPISTPRDLLEHPLIHSESRLNGWSDWFRALDIADVEIPGGLRFTHSAHSLRAAADSLGVALENDMMAADYLADGSLVSLFDDTPPLPRPAAYYFVCPFTKSHEPRVCAVRTWAREEFRNSERAIR